MVLAKNIILVFTLIVPSIHLLLAVPMGHSSEFCVQQPRDVFFVVDGSASINPSHFLKVRKFLMNMVSQLHIGKDKTHVGMLQFSSFTTMEFGLDGSYDQKTVLGKIRKFGYHAGKDTLTHVALKKVANQVFTKTGGDRPTVQDIVVLFTDGHSRNRKKTIFYADKLKKKGVRIVAVGAGKSLHKFRRELFKIASSRADVKTVARFNKLDSIVDDLVQQVCRIVTTPSAPTTITPTTRSTIPTTSSTRKITTMITTGTTVKPQRETKATPASRIRGFAPVRERGSCSNSKPKDILFVVDGTANYYLSRAKSTRHFNKVKKFIRSVIGGIKNDYYRVGVIQFSGKNKASMDVDFSNIASLSQAMVGVSLMRQQRGYDRRIGEAFVEANNQFYRLDGLMKRENYPNVIVLITRGRSPSDDEIRMQAELKMLHLRDTRIIAVGTGMTYRHIEPLLKTIAYEEDIFVAKYKGLKHLAGRVLDRICVDEPIIPKPAYSQDSFQCHRIPHDIFFVVDGSASIDHSNFRKVKKFLMDLTALLRLDVSEINTGLIQFSEKERTSEIWSLGRHSFLDTVLAIQNMQYQAGRRTMTGDALSRVDQLFNGRGGDRPGVQNMIVLITDGNAHDIAVARKLATRLKKVKNITIVTIGAGTRRSLRYFKKELEELATSPKYSMTVDYDELPVFAEKAFPLLCRSLRRL